MTLPRVAIIIPTRGRLELLKRCLRQVLPYISQHPGCEVVVSDDGEALETKAALAGEFDGVRVVQGPRRGPAANRNWGAAHSNGDLLIFLDDDCRPDSSLVAEYRHAAATYHDSGVFEGSVTAEGKYSSFADVSPENETGGRLWSCNIAVRRDLFSKVGGFDERFPFPAMEDMDFHFRVSRESSIQFVPGARVFHAIERRAGWKNIKHHSLSFLLYLHLHGLKDTGMGPVFHARALARLTWEGSSKFLRRDAARDLGHLLLLLLANAEIMLITALWKIHARLAKIFFPACCAGCQSLHASLSDKSIECSFGSQARSL